MKETQSAMSVTTSVKFMGKKKKKNPKGRERGIQLTNVHLQELCSKKGKGVCCPNHKLIIVCLPLCFMKSGLQLPKTTHHPLNSHLGFMFSPINILKVGINCSTMHW